MTDERREKDVPSQQLVGSFGLAEDTSFPVEEMELLEERIGYVFRDSELLSRALTHPSYANERRSKQAKQQNQRLEFLGDSVLGMLIATELFNRESSCDEGSLTRYLSGLVCEPALATKARELGLGAFIRLGKGEESQGGRDRDSILCDCYEALLAAVYLDGGFDVVHAMVARLHQEELASLTRFNIKKPNHKGRLQKLVQARHSVQPSYHIVDKHGPEHGRVFVAQVRVNQEVVGVGEGKAKKVAEQEAAKDALGRLGKKEGP